ncbi:MAG: hypothetical protein U5J62_00255 [Desulfurivibrio sp.]|nr:hypothetical protein [Desulfurivibrio sp.]
MVISDELRFPVEKPVPSFQKERKVDEIFEIPASSRIGAFKREWHKVREKWRQPPRRRHLNDGEKHDVQEQVRRANRNFADHGTPLRLVLTQTDDGYQLDVYDCTGDTECQLAHDIHISLDELPILLRNLEGEIGLLVDTVT